MAADLKTEKKPGTLPDCYTASSTAKNTIMDNYGALYCKVHTLSSQ